VKGRRAWRFGRLPRVRRRWLRFAAPLAALMVLLGGGGLAALETETVGNFGDALLWALSLMTTVGFVGGLPHTVAGKLIAAALMLCGFSLLALTTAGVSSLFVREDEAPEEEREHAFELEVLRELRALHARLDRLEHPRRGSLAEEPAEMGGRGTRGSAARSEARGEPAPGDEAASSRVR
jgi:voltage-gated potassium channel